MGEGGRTLHNRLKYEAESGCKRERKQKTDF